MGIRLALTLIGVLISGCTQGHCRRQADAPELTPVPPPAEASSKSVEDQHIFVYKYDGSVQCGGGKPVSLEAMSKQLGGITIFSSVKKPDGLMHIQVCGSNTGVANVYEIPAKSQKAAEAKGFKKWSFE